MVHERMHLSTGSCTHHPCQASCIFLCTGACTQSALWSMIAHDASHLVGMMESSNSSCHGRAGRSQLGVHQLEVCQHPHTLQQHTQAALIQQRCFSCNKQTSRARLNDHDELQAFDAAAAHTACADAAKVPSCTDRLSSSFLHHRINTCAFEQLVVPAEY